MIEILTLKCGIVNCYILKSHENYILVDTGNGGSEKKIEKAFKRHGLSPKGLKLIILTHGHQDHVGCAHILVRNMALKLL